ncbi:phthiocerol/phthiodiolone dimycocerosyl transferase family protein [Sandaracinus amylolyticus]|uniref:phthiocerol/phthiodiolone dimycocerosyl transferase family protein n=1 Tax=Sandaracinus amylolyticus TaxID=927083 RepID=UPI0012EEDFA2|nr:hypothetical protein [Sandaracinus amylolyticus]
MTSTRATNLTERMTDALDRCFTMDFSTLARVHGELDERAIPDALRALSQRHPLLSARVIRRAGLATQFALGEAPPIALSFRDAQDAWASFSYRHRVWDDAGPRGVLDVVRHGPHERTFVLTLHHLVSDGRSGVMVMRDLLRLLGEPGRALPPVESPGQAAYYPEPVRGWRRLRPTLAALSAMQRPPQPVRLRPDALATPDESEVVVRPIVIDPERTEALTRAARETGATLHGLVSAALAMAVAREMERGEVVLDVMHPVDLRRRVPEMPRDVVGYYVSSVSTRLRTDPAGDPLALAREATNGVRRAIDAGEHWTSAPGGGAVIVAATQLMGRALTSSLLPKHVFTGALAVTNLGVLEQLGLEHAYGPLEVRACGFAAAPSILGSLLAAVSTFRGTLTIAVGHTVPLISRERGERIAAHTEEILARAADRAALSLAG